MDARFSLPTTLQTKGWRSIIFIIGGIVTMFAIWALEGVMRFEQPLFGASLVEEAECLYSNGFPNDNAVWKHCSLPDNWDESHPNYSGYGWYRITIPGQAVSANKSLGILLSSVCMNAEVYANGILFGSGGRMIEPVTRNWNHALYFSLTPYLIPNESNEILIHVYGHANGNSGLGMVQWGDDATMRPVFQRTAQISDMVSLLALGTVLVIGTLFLLLWLGTRKKSYGLFAMGALIGSIYIADTVILYPPFNWSMWERITQLSIGWSQLFFLLFMLSAMGKNIRWLKRCACTNIAIGTLCILVIDQQYLLPIAALWIGITFIWDLVVLFYLFAAWRKQSEFLMLVIGICLMGVIAAFMHDWIPWVMGRGTTPPYLFFLGPVGFTIAVAFFLLHQMVEAHRRELQFLGELQRSLNKQEKKLNRRHKKIVALERKNAVHLEQERIVRELHDGVGFHIVGAMVLAENQQPDLRENLTLALDELRMLMDSVDASVDFYAMLGMMRERLSVRANQQGATLQWGVNDRIDGFPDDAQSTMHLLRIVQEVITNSLKHASPSKICLSTDRRGLKITDNGNGFNVDQAVAGRGLKNIRWRAAQIDAQCTIQSDVNGTAIHLCWGASS